MGSFDPHGPAAGEGSRLLCAAMAEYSVGIDVGGTFTDVTIVEMGSGEAWLTKVESTPADPSIGFINGLRQGAALAGVSAEEVGRIIHGTTVATNAVLERRPT